tara:strand:- start:4453 stop:4683 length:231 start_codon:yes stop_codon:yes gene_type:complete
MFKSLKEIINKNIKIKSNDYFVFKLIVEEFKKINTKEIVENLLVYDYNNKELTLKASSPAWRNEGSLIKNQIKKKY